MLKLGIVVTPTLIPAEEGRGLPAAEVNGAARETQERISGTPGGHEHRQYGFHCISVGKGGAEEPAGIGGPIEPTLG